MEQKYSANTGKISMGKARARRLALFFPALLALRGVPAFADSIDNPGQNNTLIVNAVMAGTPDPDYNLFTGTGYTNPLDNPFFSSLGIAPGSFLFGPNTVYDYAGWQRIDILSVIGDPAQGIGGSQDPNTALYSVVFSDSGAVIPSGAAADTLVASPTPEPKAAWLFLAGLIMMSGWASLRVRNLRPVAVAREPSIKQQKFVRR